MFVFLFVAAKEKNWMLKHHMHSSLFVFRATEILEEVLIRNFFWAGSHVLEGGVVVFIFGWEDEK
jgi:hypothetical protein